MRDKKPESLTDAVGADYNSVRGAAVVTEARRFLDQAIPLEHGSHADATGYSVEQGALLVSTPEGPARLADGAAFLGYRGEPLTPEALVFVHHGVPERSR